MSAIRRGIGRFALTLALPPLLAASALYAWCPADQPDAFLLLERAAANDLRSDPIHPFHLHASLSVWISSNKPMEGTYEIYWLGHDNWSEVILMPGYSRVRVWSQDKMWQTRSIDYEPVRFGQLQEMLTGFRTDLRVGGNDDKVVKASERNDKGISQACVSIHPGYGYDREMCFDSASADLLSESFSGDDEEVREFSDYREFSGKRYPAVMRLAYHKRPAVELRVDQVSPLPQNATLKPPAGAEVWESCEFPRAARRVDKTAPEYPPLARREYESGVVILYGVIEEDGSLSHLRVVQSAHPMLDVAAFAAVRKFHYGPASCGKPIRTETQVEVIFKLGR